MIKPFFSFILYYSSTIDVLCKTSDAFYRNERTLYAKRTLSCLKFYYLQVFSSAPNNNWIGNTRINIPHFPGAKYSNFFKTLDALYKLKTLFDVQVFIRLQQKVKYFKQKQRAFGQIPASQFSCIKPSRNGALRQCN